MDKKIKDIYEAKKVIKKSEEIEYKQAKFALAVTHRYKEKMMTVESLAEKLGVEPRTVYRHLQKPPLPKSNIWKKYDEILKINEWMSLIYRPIEDKDIVSEDDVIDKIKQLPTEFQKQCMFMFIKGIEIFTRITTDRWLFLCDYSSLTKKQSVIVDNVLARLANNNKDKIYLHQKEFINSVKEYKKYSIFEKDYDEKRSYDMELGRRLSKCSPLQLYEIYHRFDYLLYIEEEQWDALINYVIASYNENCTINYFLEEIVKSNYLEEKH